MSTTGRPATVQPPASPAPKVRSRNSTTDDYRWTRFYYAANYTLTDGFQRESCDSLPLTGVLPVIGEYYLIVVADAFPGQPPNNYPGVVEANENNNSRASALRVTITP